MSIASCCGSRSYSRSAIANGRAIPLPSARGSAGQPAIDRGAGQRPPGRHRARSRRTGAGSPAPGRSVVEARARAPHAPASASARATRRSSGQSDVMRRSSGRCRGHVDLDPPPGWTVPRAVYPQYGPAAPARDGASGAAASPLDGARQPVAGQEAAIGERRVVRREPDAAIAEPLGARARSPRGPPPRRGCSRPR